MSGSAQFSKQEGKKFVFRSKKSGNSSSSIQTEEVEKFCLIQGRLAPPGQKEMEV